MGTLHVVATPIGNLEDVTLRALRVLREAALILAEDTRRTRVLLDRHGIAARPRSLHAHNEAARSEEALAALRRGADVALVSDAGTPLVSDPGARLVAAAIAEGHPVVSIPGPSAVLSALTVSGLAGGAFAFLGFLPRRDAARRDVLRRHRALPGALVLFESPRRVAGTLRVLREELGDRPACVARELTKLHEEVVRAPLSALAERFAAGARGEVTIVVAGADAEPGVAVEAEPGAEPADRAASAEELDAQVRPLVEEGRSPREIASALARDRRWPRRVIYARAVALRGGA